MLHVKRVPVLSNQDMVVPVGCDKATWNQTCLPSGNEMLQVELDTAHLKMS